MTLMATETSQSTKIVIKKPNLYKVVFNNDDATPAEFVKDVLKAIFAELWQTALASEEVATPTSPIPAERASELINNSGATVEMVLD